MRPERESYGIADPKLKETHGFVMPAQLRCFISRWLAGWSVAIASDAAVSDLTFH